MARRLLEAEVWVFEGTDEPAILREIAEWLKNIGIGLRSSSTVFSITFDEIEKEEQEEEGPLEGAKVVAYVSFA